MDNMITHIEEPPKSTKNLIEIIFSKIAATGLICKNQLHFYVLGIKFLK